jgi:hypothetical protein
MRITTGLLFALLLAGARGWASDVQIQLDSSTLTASPGGTVTFSGVIVNEDSFVIDLNSIDVTLDGMFMVDDTPFFLGPASIGTPSGTQTIDFQMFAVIVNLPYTDPPGIKTGTLTILGNVETNGVPNLNVQNPLGSATFGVNVTGAVPEPSTFALMLAAMAGAGGLVWLRRKLRLN